MTSPVTEPKELSGSANATFDRSWKPDPLPKPKPQPKPDHSTAYDSLDLGDSEAVYSNTTDNASGPKRSGSHPRSGTEVTPNRLGEAKSTSRLDEALVSLRPVLNARARTAESAMRASRLLLEAAEGEMHLRPRHAAMALFLSDALAFSDFDEIAERPDAFAPVAEAFSCLRSSYIRDDRETHVIDGLLASGWQLTPDFDYEQFGEMLPADAE